MPNLTGIRLKATKFKLKKFTNYRQLPVFKGPQIVLSNAVSEKGEKKRLDICLTEMSLMLACLQRNDFNEAPCSKETQSYQKCLVEHKAAKLKKKELEEKGDYTQLSGRLPAKQVNSLLRQYPNPRPKKDS